jgi:hypothetical protein
MSTGHSGRPSHTKLSLARRATVALTAMIAALGLLIAPGAGSANTRSAKAADSNPPGLALTGEPPAAPVHGGYSSAPAATSTSDPGPTPASTGPPPPPVRRGTPLPCPLEWCQKLIEHLCHRFDCAKLSAEFRGTASKKSKVVRQALHRDTAFQPPWNGVGFVVHHIVPQGDAQGGVAEFAQWLLQRVGTKADDIDNLAALRAPEREKGTLGYKQLDGYPSLQQRMAHSDTLSKFYYQQVNEWFARWVRSHGGRLPNEADVRSILRAIKRDLYAGGNDFIKPGIKPRAADVG